MAPHINPEFRLHLHKKEILVALESGTPHLAETESHKLRNAAAGLAGSRKPTQFSLSAKEFLILDVQSFWGHRPSYLH